MGIGPASRLIGRQIGMSRSLVSFAALRNRALGAATASSMAKFFEAGAWLAGNPAQSCSSGVHVSQPAPIGCWTKAAAGGGSDGAHRYRFGDHSGACLLQISELQRTALLAST